MSEFTIPDMIEPIVAWRVWNMDANGLASLNSGSMWPEKLRMEARCGHAGPTSSFISGWEAVSPDGAVSWVRDGLPHERLNNSHLGAQGATGPAGVTAVTMALSAAGGFASPVIHLEPAPESPSDLTLPRGWTWRIGTREVELPPRHLEVPDEKCSCGLYALADRQNLLRRYHGDVLGEVYLWGKVIEGEWGYRAQYAYPKALYPSRGRSEDMDALRRYGVPIHDDMLRVIRQHVHIGKASVPRPPKPRTSIWRRFRK